MFCSQLKARNLNASETGSTRVCAWVLSRDDSDDGLADIKDELTNS